MAKKSIIQREEKRSFLVKKYSNLRLSLKNKFEKEESLDEKLKIYRKIQKLPRNSSSSRLV